MIKGIMIAKGGMTQVQDEKTIIVFHRLARALKLMGEVRIGACPTCIYKSLPRKRGYCLKVK